MVVVGLPGNETLLAIVGFGNVPVNEPPAGVPFINIVDAGAV